MTSEAAHDLVRSDPQRAEELLSGLLSQADLAIEDVRRISHELRPPALDSLGLIGALNSHAASQRIPITVRTPEQLPALPAAVEVAAYRIALEAVRNVVLHADAATCCVTLRIDGAAGQAAALHLEVTDTGVGLRNTPVRGVGLASMTERAAELGGSFTIEPGRTRGTRVEAILPIPSLQPG
jgi:signal transduction histidine kinase